ncbi:MAG: DNA polymerase IV [Calditrichaeota bacterium]|nr:MAG: DNA polymerase IV [Calditrichota bacterium]
MKNQWKKVIVHVDMDAFFASVEQLHNPSLRGKPVIVGADPRGGKGRGVVSTASYEARKYGVHSAMPISQAYKLCPHGVYLKPNGRLYKRYSELVMDILHQFTPRVQAISIDEAFLDVTGSVHLFGDVETLGREIKKRIYQQTGLTASVGIAPSKSVAKIASDFQKPDGLTIVPPNKVQEFLEPLEVTRLWGVGKKTFEVLSRMGIETVGQLRAYPLEVLEQKMGKMGAHLYRMANGIDERDVHDRDEIKSVSHERTFGKDERELEVLTSTMLLLSEKVCSRLRKYGLKGKTVQLKVRYSDFSTFTRHKTLSDPTNLTEEVFNVSLNLFQEFVNQDKAIRLIGVGVSQLSSEKGGQITLWDIEKERKLELERVMDKIQEKFGKEALTHAQTLTSHKRRKEKE